MNRNRTGDYTPDPHIFLQQRKECFPPNDPIMYKVVKLLNTTQFIIGALLTKDRVDELVTVDKYKVTIT